MPASDPPPEPLTWTVWPAGQRPHAAAAVVMLILGVSWYGYAGFGSVLYSVIALVVLTASLASFLFPTTYTLDDEGVQASGFLHGKHMAWKDLACFIRAPDFVALSTADPPTERSCRQGMILRLGANGDEVVARISRHLSQWERPQP